MILTPNLMIVNDATIDNVRSILLVHNLPMLTNRYAGLDPGTTHIGLAQVDNNFVRLCEIKIPRDNTTGKRIEHIWSILTEHLLDMKIFVIEGASYGDRYRQVELQDIRCGATAWAMNRLGNIEIDIVPPSTIRKIVFGSAKIKNPWKEQGIPDNAAAALGCALYPIAKGNAT